MRLAWIVTALLGVFLPLRSASGQDSTDAWQTQRESMVEEILINAGIKNERVLAAMRATPRHLCVPRHLR